MGGLVWLAVKKKKGSTSEKDSLILGGLEGSSTRPGAEELNKKGKRGVTYTRGTRVLKNVERFPMTFSPRSQAGREQLTVAATLEKLFSRLREEKRKEES